MGPQCPGFSLAWFFQSTRLMRLNFSEHKGKWIGFGFLLLLVVARILAPAIILNRMNAYLGTFSPLYQMHVQRLHLHVFRMAYSFENLEGALKPKGEAGGAPHADSELAHSKNFLTIANVDVSLAWRELVRGRIVTDVDMEKVNVMITSRTINALSGEDKTQAKQDAKNVKDATIPFDLERLRLQNSRIELSDAFGFPPEQSFVLDPVNVTGNNLTPPDKSSLSLFTIIGTIEGNSKFRAVAEAKMNHTPVDWSVNLEMKDFDLVKINPYTRSAIPLTFKSGKLSLYSAVQSVHGDMKGYLKPFLNNVVFVGDKGDFKNVGQFLIEIAGTIGNFFLKNNKTHDFATKINFHSEGGKVKMETLSAVGAAFKNDFGKGLSQSLDETLELP
jgi:hypothetical protein